MQRYEENEERMEDDSIDLFAIAQDMWKNFRYYKKRFLFLILAVTVIFSSVRILNYKPNYKSYITFVITQKEKQGSNTNSFTKSTWDVGVTNLMNNTFPYIMERGGLDNQIRQEMGLKEEDYLPVSLSAEVTEDLNLLTINAYSEDGKMAQTAVDVLEDYYPSYAYEIYSDCEMAVIDKSSISGEPVGSRNVIKNIILGFIGGCFIALIILGIMSIKAPTIRNNNDLKKYFNLSCLGLIPLVHFKRERKI